MGILLFGSLDQGEGVERTVVKVSECLDHRFAHQYPLPRPQRRFQAQVPPFSPPFFKDTVGELEATPSFPRTRESIGVSRCHGGGFLGDTAGGV